MVDESPQPETPAPPRRRGCFRLKWVLAVLGFLFFAAASGHRNKPEKESQDAGLTHRAAVEMTEPGGGTRRIVIYWDEVKDSRAAHRIWAYVWRGWLDYEKSSPSVGNGMRLVQVGVRKAEEGGDRLVLLARIEGGGMFEVIYALDNEKLVRESVRILTDE